MRNVGWIAGMFCLVWICGCASAPLLGARGPATFRVEDYGAKPDADFDSGPAIREAIAAAIAHEGEAEVVLRAGIYRVLPAQPGQNTFPIRKANGVTVRGAGEKTEIIVNDPKAGLFNVRESEGVVLKDFVIDYDPLPNTQGRIVAIDVENFTFDLDLEEGFPSLSESWFTSKHHMFKLWGLLFDATEPHLKIDGPSHVMIDRFEHVENRVWRFWLDKPHHGYVHRIDLGDRFVELARHISGNALFFYDCKDSGVENVTVHSAPALASGIVRSEGVFLNGMKIRFREGSLRLLTTNADGAHCAQNRKGPLIENCYFEGMADDAINIYAPPSIVREVESPTSVITTIGCELEPGDLLQIMDPRVGRVIDEVTLASVEKAPQAYRLVFERPVEGITAGEHHSEATTIYNLSCSGEGYIIRNNHMNNHRRHGMLLRAGGGLVENNLIEGVAGLGIVVTNEPNWPEGPFARDVVIRGNTIVGVGTSRNYSHKGYCGAIQIKATKYGGGLAEGREIKNIVIEDNRIVDPPCAGIFVGGVDGIRISNNRIEARIEARRAKESGAVVLVNCANVDIDDLEVTDRRERTTSAIEINSSVQKGEEGVSIDGLEAELSEKAVPIADGRPD